MALEWHKTSTREAMAPRPIETRAYGCRFRSRLEARWAVFFTELGLQWEYEPEGFDLGELGFYLPDFLVKGFPDLPETIWVEVKPTEPDATETNRLRRLCCNSGINGFFAIGTEPFHSIIKETQLGIGDPWHGMCKPLTHRQVPHSTFVPIGAGNVAKLVGTYDTPKGQSFYQELWRLMDGCHVLSLAAPLASASQAALSARFEHGEQP